ncbi:MAG TPA: tRNA 2-thiouridine(34) synthase MnmA [Terracidiphilus sp.]|nr:tRNA 2-thiouridine(34) synthase MnmA [Terracidiphilus sp.]
MTENTTIAVAMSGGVDSSTVAALLAREGDRSADSPNASADTRNPSAASRNAVVGLTLQLWDQTRLAGKHGIPEAPKAGRCCSLDDVYDARRVAEHLGIPYYVVNQEERFERDVVRPFVGEYLAGRTPIPCSLCNNHLKFDQLLQTARSIGAERIATGHYAVNEYDPDRKRWILKRPADLKKDQTYFLFGLTQEQLAHTLFPLGRMTKPEVRETARRHGLQLAEKPDSQEICFIPGGDYKQFLTAYLEEQGEAFPETAGELVASNGEVLGRHEGTFGFTVGQRKGLGVASPSPLYVLQVDPASRRVTVGADAELLTRELRARRLNWISIARLEGPMRVRVKIRHRHEPAWATLEPAGEDEVTAIFDEPQRAVTPGQAAVFYDGDEVVGGGWIERARPKLRA